MTGEPRRPRIARLGRYQPPGTSPGLVSYDPEASPSVVRAIGYGPDEIREIESLDIRDLDALRAEWRVVWIDVVGFGRGPELESLREALGLHILAIEDVVNVGQRAKVEAYENELFVIGRMASSENGTTEQVSIFLGEGWLLTVQERAGDPFDPVRERLRQGAPRLRTRGADYLLYALLDAVVDSYFPVLDGIGDELEALEEQVFDAPTQNTAVEIHAIRRQLVGLRKSLNPHREALNTLLRDDHPLVAEDTHPFLRDVYDHALRSAELLDAYREMTGDLGATYMSAISNRMNEVMKVLTIIASIFIPLSFIAGLYGMNFDPSVSGWNMPELGWRFGYPFALGLMAAVGGGFLWYMWRRGWLD